MIQIHQLPASGTIADGDMIPFDTGTVSKYITAGNLLGQQKMIVLPNTQDITASVDALTVGRTYNFYIAAGEQATTGLPSARSFYGTAFAYNANSKKIVLYSMSGQEMWVKGKASGTWDNWRPVLGRLNYTPTAGSLMTNGGLAYLSGSMLTWELATQVSTSGTLTASDYFGRIEGLKVPGSLHCVLFNGSTPIVGRVVYSNGGIEFRNNNTNTTLTAGNYVIGSITVPVEEV